MNKFLFSQATLAIFILLIFGSLSATAQTADKIVSRWLNQEKDAAVEIYKKGNKYFGKIVWMQKEDNGDIRYDDNNPDATLRKRRLKNADILKDFTFNGSDTWDGGTVYDPKNGKTYSCKMWMQDGNLHIRGYIGFSLLGRTAIWTRPAANHPALQ